VRTSTVWLLWLGANLTLLLSTRNPIYLFICIVGYLVSGFRISTQSQAKSWVKNNFRFLLAMILLSALINGLFSHMGNKIILSLPERWWLIGGDITLESLVFGAINGSVIGSLYLLFNIINMSLSVKQITRLIPRAFHPIAMTVTISLTFFPSIKQRAQEIKEAQMIRGNRMKKIKDWLPIFVPLLVSSLERAIQLSEAMTARGFHSQENRKNPEIAILGLIIALFAIFSGWILRVYVYPVWISVLLYLLGAILIIIIFNRSGHQNKTTSFRKDIWHPIDIQVSVILSIILIILLFLIFNDLMPSLTYSPYPELSFPPFQLIGLLFSGLSFYPIVHHSYD